MKKSNLSVATFIFLGALVIAGGIIYFAAKMNSGKAPQSVSMQGSRTLRADELPTSFTGSSTQLSSEWVRYKNDFLHFSVDAPSDMEFRPSGMLVGEGDPNQYTSYALIANDMTGKERILTVNSQAATGSLSDEYHHWVGNEENYLIGQTTVSGVPALTRKFDMSKDPVHTVAEQDEERTTLFIWKGYFYRITTRGIPMADLDRIWKSFKLLD